MFRTNRLLARIERRKVESDLRLEIGQVLFIDLVGYSKLLIEEQKERLGQLAQIVLAHAPIDTTGWDVIITPLTKC